jgi:hypothetical protein
VVIKNQQSDDSWAPPTSAGILFSGVMQRSAVVRRPVNAGLLALSTLHGDLRRRLLGEWLAAGSGTSSLLDFIADQLPDPSPELALCRVEQLMLRATHRASAFEAPDGHLFKPQCVVRRARHAGVVLFPGGFDLLLNKLLQLESLPAGSRFATPLLVAPGLQPLCRIASPSEHEVWNRLTGPTAADALGRLGCPMAVIETLLGVGALEYA